MLCNKLNRAQNQKHDFLNAVQIKAKLHNELVQARINDLAAGVATDRIKKFSQIQEKQRHAAEQRAKNLCRVKSGCYSNAA